MRQAISPAAPKLYTIHPSGNSVPMSHAKTTPKQKQRRRVTYSSRRRAPLQGHEKRNKRRPAHLLNCLRREGFILSISINSTSVKDSFSLASTFKSFISAVVPCFYLWCFFIHASLFSRCFVMKSKACAQGGVLNPIKKRWEVLIDFFVTSSVVFFSSGFFHL